jgi:hypothetical protein
VFSQSPEEVWNSNSSWKLISEIPPQKLFAYTNLKSRQYSCKKRRLATILVGGITETKIEE